MIKRVHVPPIKTQGIKTKLVPWILKHVQLDKSRRWVEPFLGSGVVGFNLQPREALFADKNPHIINFYDSIKQDKINSRKVRKFLEQEGKKLLEKGETYYYEVRDRFNQDEDPLDFLFLNRSCFNGLMRFNSKGKFNTPFGRKPDRFRKAYITKIVNQVKYVEQCLKRFEWTFLARDFREIISEATSRDVIYFDPPYIGRHANYYDNWTERDEHDLFTSLSSFSGKFLLSTWYKNKYRENEFLKKYWTEFRVITKEHFYHVGGKINNRNSMIEALVINHDPNVSPIP